MSDKVKTIAMAIVAVAIYLGLILGLFVLIAATWAVGIWAASGILAALGVGGGALPFLVCLALAAPLALLFGWRVTG